ncbi:AraC family transcriptional regulator [Poseidonocella sp. HB161398]|uniref:helix-turn-helix domain-containing protein n=1 Tax=Poseidonocella sp. HB161398 TaxID=2320855 RepID=UPI0011089226|nr:AraC family transcriptional regulator [Poseidonocella sp. HB161398]
MTFLPRMTARTRAIRTLRPLAFRRLPGAIADVWHVRGAAGGGGFYSSPDPRLVVFLGEPPAMELRCTEGGPAETGVRALYIPPGLPLWSELAEAQDFAHLDLHLEAGPLAQRLGPEGRAAIGRAAFLKTGRAAPLAELFAAEVERPTRPALMLDGLLSALLAETLDLAPEPAMAQGGLAPAVRKRLEGHAARHLGRRIPTAELAEIAGLSESWFARAFRDGEGVTPQRWLTGLRLDRAAELMADPGRDLAGIAACTGFADQAHLTRAFRRRHGTSPAAWRRAQFPRNGSSGGGTVQAAPEYPS